MYALKFPNSSLFVNKHSLSIRYDLKVLPYLYNHLSFTATDKRADIFKTEDLETVFVYQKLLKHYFNLDTLIWKI